MSPIRTNTNIVELTELVTPKEVKHLVPNTDIEDFIAYGQEEIKRIISGEDDRMIVVVGPCSIHDKEQAIAYAKLIKPIADQVKDKILVVMRAYFEKPRSVLGWKGLVNDPHLDGTHDMNAGLVLAREIAVGIAKEGVYVGTEFLNPVIPQYLDDVTVWAAIGARNLHSQTSREFASGLSMAIGMKNCPEGGVKAIIDGIRCAAQSHHFPAINQEGQICNGLTRGNDFAHAILRGGTSKPNYNRVTVETLQSYMKAAEIAPSVMIDCSHGNSGKDFRKQGTVLDNVIAQRAQGNTGIIGVMIESNINAGKQSVPADMSTLDKSTLQYGVSITDSCVGMKETIDMLERSYEVLASGILIE